MMLPQCITRVLHMHFREMVVRFSHPVRVICVLVSTQAADFAESFYTSLLRGDTVKQAFMLGSDRLLGVSDNPAEGHKFL